MGAVPAATRYGRLDRVERRLGVRVTEPLVAPVAHSLDALVAQSHPLWPKPIEVVEEDGGGR
jgi:hypothetical protein